MKTAMQTKTNKNQFFWSAEHRFVVVATAAMALAIFAAGYVVGRHRSVKDASQEVHRQFMEFLQLGTELGFVTIDHQRLDELIITMSEAEWEDRDAAERHQTNNCGKQMPIRRTP